MTDFLHQRRSGGGDNIRWLAATRVIVLAAAAVLALVVSRAAPGIALIPLLVTLVALAALNLAINVYLRRITPAGVSPALRQRIVAIQALADIIGLTLVIHFSGVGNPFYPSMRFRSSWRRPVGSRDGSRYAALVAFCTAQSWWPMVGLVAAPQCVSWVCAFGSASYVVAQAVAAIATAFVAAEGTTLLVGVLHARARDLEETAPR